MRPDKLKLTGPASPAASEGPPATWEDAFALLASRFGGLMLDQADKHARQVADLQQDLADCRGLVQQLTDARAQDASEAAAAAERHSQALAEALAAGAAAREAADNLAHAVQDQADTIAGLAVQVGTLQRDAMAMGQALGGKADADLVQDMLAGTERAHIALTDRLDQVSQTAGDARDLAARAVDGLAGVTEVAATKDSLRQLVQTVEGHHERLDGLVQSIAATDAATASTFSDIGQSVEKLTADAVTILANITGVQTYAGDRFDVAMKAITTTEQKTCDAVTAINEAMVRRMDAGDEVVNTLAESVEGLAERVVEVHNLAGEAREAVAAVDAAAQAALDTARQSLKDTKTTLDAMPRNLVIDREGRLIAFNGDGTEKDLGLVCGRDGKNAADLVALKAEGNRISLVRGDGHEITCELPTVPAPAAAVPPAPMTEKYDVDDMVKMREAGATWDKIGKKHKISGVHAGRLVKRALEK
jgi:hypothetical protein